MSRAFVREGDEVENRPERLVSPHPNDVTREGLAQIEAALRAAQEAYTAAQMAVDRGALAGASRDLRYWTARRRNAILVPEPVDNSVVRFGHTVTIVREDNREQTFRIVGEDEAEPAKGTISHVSPLAQALFGKGVGDVVKIGVGEAEILRIR